MISDKQLERDKQAGLIRGLALMYWENSNDIGCMVCGHFCDQTDKRYYDDPVTCECKCHEYPDDADLIVGDYVRTIQFREALGGRGYAVTKKIIHDKETNCTEIKGDGKKHEPYDQHVDDGKGCCIFCPRMTAMKTMIDFVGGMI